MDIDHTCAMLKAALADELDSIPAREDPAFKLHLPTGCPGITDEVFHPESTWSDKAAYKNRAYEHALAFSGNFRQFEHMVSYEVMKAGPMGQSN